MRKTLAVLATVSAILALFLAAHYCRSRIECEGPVCFVCTTRFYMGFKDAVVIRVDDFTVDSKLAYKVPDNLVKPREWFRNYQYKLIEYIIKNHPEVKLVVGLITGSVGGNTSAWRIYRVLVRKYGWEIACHTRLHVKPPRSPSDLLGCIRDVEGNITGYKVVTYIPPFGKTSRSELKLMREHGILIVMKTTPLQLRLPRDWMNLHYTVKMAHNLPWSYWLRITHYIAEKIHGVIIIYTHATSYDWRSWRELLDSFKKMINIVEDGETWITTPRTLLSYELERSFLRVTKINSTTFKILLSKQATPELTPVTLEFTVMKERVKEVLVNGKPIREIPGPTQYEATAYYVRRGKVFITLKPPATIKFVLG